MSEVGRELFRLVLGRRDVWESARHCLGDTRIEIETEVGDALVPWELMRDPVADLPLAASHGPGENGCQIGGGPVDEFGVHGNLFYV